MFNPQIKAGKMLLAHKQWIIEKKIIGRVTPIEFIDFKFSRRSNSNKPVPFNKGGQSFIGEIWKCIDENGHFVIVTFKQDIGNDYRNNTSLTVNKNPIEDGWSPNLLLDSYEEFKNNIVNRTKYPNKTLANHIKWHKKRLQITRELLLSSKDAEEKQMLFYYLRHKQSPTVVTLRALENARSKSPVLYQKIIENIKQSF